MGWAGWKEGGGVSEAVVEVGLDGRIGRDGWR